MVLSYYKFVKLRGICGSILFPLIIMKFLALVLVLVLLTNVSFQCSAVIWLYLICFWWNPTCGLNSNAQRFLGYCGYKCCVFVLKQLLEYRTFIRHEAPYSIKFNYESENSGQWLIISKLQAIILYLWSYSPTNLLYNFKFQAQFQIYYTGGLPVKKNRIRPL